ncbi:MAG: hypothetical protein II179_00140 [Alphaproteobacteria bacterium]|jgi:hypothetical protein|nr:hypothetical protein [Alphaproteobacteria bacterium]
MNEEEKMFRIGSAMLILVVALTVALQVCYRTQNRERRDVRRMIRETQQDIALAQTEFAMLVRPENLRNAMDISGLSKVEAISFNKSVEIQELPDRIDNK